MILKEITDYREGQVYEQLDENFQVVIDDLHTKQFKDDGSLIYVKRFFKGIFKDYKFVERKDTVVLLGQVGINYDIVDKIYKGSTTKALVKQPRERFEKDDVVKYGAAKEVVFKYIKNTELSINCPDSLTRIIFYSSNNGVNADDCTKLGELGWNYEYVNSRTVKND